jgi:hypothetical protein
MLTVCAGVIRALTRLVAAAFLDGYLGAAT